MVPLVLTSPVVAVTEMAPIKPIRGAHFLGPHWELENKDFSFILHAIMFDAVFSKFFTTIALSAKNITFALTGSSCNTNIYQILKK